MLRNAPILVSLILIGLRPSVGIAKAQANSRGGTNQASTVSVVLDASSGRVLSRSGDVNIYSAPGSTVKPFVLLAALRSGAIHEHETIACRGTLVIQGHNLACSHPRDVTALDAREALAESCNTYFASVAERIPSATLANGFRSYGISPLVQPRDAEERALLALGLKGVTVTPLQLAQAYQKLAKQLNEGTVNETKVVRDGLIASVQTGMANAARVQSMVLGGKTGTVDLPGGRSHGWFAGLVFTGLDARTVDRVIVVFVPNGNGADAATVAGAMLSREANR